MIKKITIMNNASFDEDGVVIENLKKINFIYGTNGSGKTTISNLIQNPQDPNYGDCKIEWDSDLDIDTLVYNKKFREKNFGSSNIPGVFTLGEATKSEIEELDRKKLELKEIGELKTKINGTISSLQKQNESSQNTFQEECWKQIKWKYEPIFKDAFVGLLNNKFKFSQEILSAYDEIKERNVILYDDLVTRAKTLFGNSPKHMDELETINDLVDLAEVEQNIIWHKKIIGKNDVEIAPLIQRLGISDWVNYGKTILTSESDICPFCQKKTIDKNFREQLEAYFDETFVQDINTIKQLSDHYFSLSESISKELKKLLEKEQATPTKLEITIFEAYKDSLIQLFARNKKIIDNKITEPSRSLELQSSDEIINKLSNLIIEANKLIIKNNKTVDNFTHEREQLIDDIWYYVVNENKELISSFKKKQEGFKKGINKLTQDQEIRNKKYTELTEEIREANKTVTCIQASIDEINKTLSAFGFTNFSIVPAQNNSYQIKRTNGELVNNTLSEGEATFITFLYFMQLLKGSDLAEKANSDRIVVIDDPISSLDSTVLFVVSSLIKEEIKKIKKGPSNVKQLILLTHNIYFHKEVSFIDGRTTKNNDTYYWILRKNNNRSTIHCYENENPIRGSYELLWDELKNKNQDKISIVTLQNTMRRIYEVYFKILGKFNDDDILKKFPCNQDQEICRSLLCWVNDGSHGISDDYNIVPDDGLIEKYSLVFKKIFNVMNQMEHYNMMMGIDEAEEAVGNNT